jgi:hypothetical protein
MNRVCAELGPECSFGSWGAHLQQGVETGWEQFTLLYQFFLLSKVPKCSKRNCERIGNFFLSNRLLKCDWNLIHSHICMCTGTCWSGLHLVRCWQLPKLTSMLCLDGSQTPEYQSPKMDMWIIGTLSYDAPCSPHLHMEADWSLAKCSRH